MIDKRPGKIRTLLFALTGFGNEALYVLKNMAHIDLQALFTTGYTHPFPYYQCMPIQIYSNKMGIPVFDGVCFKEKTSINLIREINPDLIVVSTFNQKIPGEIIRIPRMGVINVHPSLLPRYRGPTPTFWVIINKEKYTGITVHFIEDEEYDKGRIICQERVEIEPNDTDGSLRFKLAKKSKSTLIKAINLLITSKKQSFTAQNEEEASYYPKRKDNYYIDKNSLCEDIMALIKACTPYPGIKIKIDGEDFFVERAESIDIKEIGGQVTEVGWVDANKYIERIRDGYVKYFTSKR